MSDLKEHVLESWDRQAQIVANVAELVTEETRKLLPSPDGWPLDEHLCHMHEVRYWWLSRFSPELSKELGDVFVETDGKQVPIDDLATIRAELAKSASAVRRAFASAGDAGAGGYDHPIHFLHHMIWHDGWHVGLISLGLRLGGHAPSDEWEEEKIWGLWRTE